MWIGPDGKEISNNSITNVTVGNTIFHSDTVATRKLIFSYLNSSHGGQYSCKASISVPGLNEVAPKVTTYKFVVTSKQ